ncbi:hypothetical protein EV700_2816 [Fluviicoccus keumensis]|uniref:Uncharacterized protein n=1 Tax=Fluviicoccus keumensis TaxID=1435465 RepID=A0A4Q7YLR5_9GAMM|nr:hypothetical protein EV700_2816 [Fluviicoccus keumensis]
MFMKCGKINTLWPHVYGVYMFFGDEWCLSDGLCRLGSEWLWSE